jgi:DNA-binding NarL/FixJ family response regulator
VACILIAEDNAYTVDVLAKIIQLKFPDWTIDSAASVPEARLKLAEARQPYDFAILDFKLPDEHGVVKGDLSLCRHVRHQSPSTRVIHITAYTDDSDITRHVDDVHLGESDSVCFIAKDKSDWMERVVARLQSFLHGDRIEAKLNALFPTSLRLQDSRHESREVSKVGSVTNRLLDLCADTRLHWKFLTSTVQQHIRSVLSVDDSRPDDVRVSLIGEVRSE